MNTQGHLQIPKPCHENWAAMSQQEQGRHCGVCCKTVMDFTAMPTEKVIEIISAKKEQQICGRFRPDQLHTNAAAKSPRNRYRIFMAALYFVFGGLLFSSCRTKEPAHKMGKVKIENSFVQDNFQNNLDTPAVRKNKPVFKKSIDSVEQEPVRLMGEPEYIPANTTKN